MDVSVAELERRLLDQFRPWRRVAVAFSGGVDSAVVAAAAVRVLGANAVAVTAVSPSLARSERTAAADLAQQLGIRHLEVNPGEFNDPNYVRNPHNRCYFCKSNLYESLQRIGPDLHVEIVVNGANLDDLGDYRPGLQAAKDYQVRSPLVDAGFRKTDVRALAQAWGLPVWDKPASPCLASRLAYGVEVTPERVERVDAAEEFLRNFLSVRELRVRCEAQELARIELPIAAIATALTAGNREVITSKLRGLGFRAVTIDLEGFRSGSLNAVVPLEVRIATADDRGSDSGPELPNRSTP